MATATIDRKTRRRRALAGALLIVGTAGLGLASAAQLNIESGGYGTAKEVFVGVNQESPYELSFIHQLDANSNYQITKVRVDGLGGFAAGTPIRATLMGNDGTELGDYNYFMDGPEDDFINIPVKAGHTMDEVAGVALSINASKAN